MALRVADRVRDTSTSTGTGNIVVTGSAPSSYVTFNQMAGITVGDTFVYSVSNQIANEYETGIGTWQGSNTFSRTTVFQSSNSNALVSFSAGTKDVICTFSSYTANGMFGIGRNRLINGAMGIDQRNAGAAQTITAGAALAYTVDRWYGYSTGANVTGQQVAGAVTNSFRYQFTGAASVTAIGFGQRIEAVNSSDMSSQTATLSVALANSLLTTVTWTAYYASSTDTFGTLASPTRTQISTGTFTVTNSVARYWAQISVPAAATTGIEIVFTVGAQTSGTWTIGNVQLEVGQMPTPFERRINEFELLLCQRYFEKTYNQSNAVGYAPGGGNNSLGAIAVSAAMNSAYLFKVSKRVAPTLTFYDGAGTSGKVSYFTTAWTNGGAVNFPYVSDAAFGLNTTIASAGYFSFDITAVAEL